MFSRPLLLLGGRASAHRHMKERGLASPPSGRTSLWGGSLSGPLGSRLLDVDLPSAQQFNLQRASPSTCFFFPPTQKPNDPASLYPVFQLGPLITFAAARFDVFKRRALPPHSPRCPRCGPPSCKPELNRILSPDASMTGRADLVPLDVLALCQGCYSLSRGAEPPFISANRPGPFFRLTVLAPGLNGDTGTSFFSV